VTSAVSARLWTAVCRYDDLQPERGTAALLGTEQIALFRLFDGSMRAIGNQDPFTGAYVLARGIVGSRGAAAIVASPLHKEMFDLSSGVCLDSPEVRIPTYPVRVRDGLVEVMPG
jgi:nitrite reductase (NADH) small subunit